MNVIFKKPPHLSVSLDLGVHKSSKNVGGDRKVDEDELRLLVKAEEGEVVPQLHGLDGIFLLWNKNRVITTYQRMKIFRKKILYMEKTLNFTRANK